MMEDTIEKRFLALENSLKDRDALERMYSEERKTLAEAFLEAVKIQANSLSVPVLKDVLVPLSMRIFTFFSILVLGLITGILGIKFLLGNYLQ